MLRAPHVGATIKHHRSIPRLFVVSRTSTLTPDINVFSSGFSSSCFLFLAICVFFLVFLASFFEGICLDLFWSFSALFSFVASFAASCQYRTGGCKKSVKRSKIIFYQIQQQPVLAPWRLTGMQLALWFYIIDTYLFLAFLKTIVDIQYRSKSFPTIDSFICIYLLLFFHVWRLRYCVAGGRHFWRKCFADHVTAVVFFVCFTVISD